MHRGRARKSRPIAHSGGDWRAVRSFSAPSDGARVQWRRACLPDGRPPGRRDHRQGLSPRFRPAGRTTVARGHHPLDRSPIPHRRRPPDKLPQPPLASTIPGGAGRRGEPCQPNWPLSTGDADASVDGGTVTRTSHSGRVRVPPKISATPPAVEFINGENAEKDAA